MHIEALNGKGSLVLCPEDLKEGDIFSRSKDYALTQLGSRLQGLFVEQDELGRALQDDNISNRRCQDVFDEIIKRRTELENMTGKRIPRDTNGGNALRKRFVKIVANRREELSNLIFDNSREPVIIE